MVSLYRKIQESALAIKELRKQNISISCYQFRKKKDVAKLPH
jgi:hypothetical protein